MINWAVWVHFGNISVKKGHPKSVATNGDLITRHRFPHSLPCARDMHSVHTSQIAANGTLYFLGMDNAVVANAYSKRFWLVRFAYLVFLKWHTEYHRINTYMQGINLPLDIIYCRWHIFDVLWQKSKYCPNAIFEMHEAFFLWDDKPDVSDQSGLPLIHTGATCLLQSFCD